MSRKLTVEQVIERAIKVHGGKYDYSLMEYKSVMDPITIVCPKHGAFNQIPLAHFRGQGCPSCGIESRAKKSRSTTDEFITKAVMVHGDKYDYSFVEYTMNKSPVIIVCPEHGPFRQAPSSHLSGNGCKECGKIKQRKSRIVGTGWVERMEKAHDGKYSYPDRLYSSHKQGTAICPEHGEFRILPYAHAAGVYKCPDCFPVSSLEDEFFSWATTLPVVLERNNRKVLDGGEIDILFPEQRVAVELDGCYWHSSAANKSKYYHRKKWELAKSKGLRLIMVREDEWLFKKDIVKSIIRCSLGLTTNRVFARNCEIGPVDKEEYKMFAEDNHLHGWRRATEVIGLFYNGELMACAAFINRITKNELARFVVKKDTVVVGGLSKLARAYGKPFFTFCENRLFDGNGYRAAGFIEVGDSKLDLSYVKGKQVVDRGKFTKKKLLSYGAVGDTEKEMAASLGWHQLWYCGHTKFEFSP